MPPKINRRFTRLQSDYTDLANLANQSDFIRVMPVESEEGFPPEEYLVTFSCRGIARVEDDGAPVPSEHHQVWLYLSRDYPAQEPSLKWMTDIWHPNIDHKEPRHVCTNAIESHFAQRSLSELVISLGEMVQYKQYHAKFEPPFPQDPEVAKWVREVAEPANILGPKKPFDPRPLLRPLGIRAAADDVPAKPVSAIKFGAPEPAQPAPKTGGIVFGKPLS